MGSSGTGSSGTGPITGPAVEDLDFWSFVRLAEGRLRALGFAHPQATELLLTLNRASGVVTYDLETTVHRPRGRSWASFRLMYVVWLAGPVESRKAAELTGMSRAAVSNLTGRLVVEGVLDRTPHDHDGRGVVLALTGAGECEMITTFGVQNEREQAWAESLTEPERRTLVRLLDKLVAGRDRIGARGRS